MTESQTPAQPRLSLVCYPSLEFKEEIRAYAARNNRKMGNAVMHLIKLGMAAERASTQRNLIGD